TDQRSEVRDSNSPDSGIRHRSPGFARWQGITVLQQLDRDQIRRAHKRHVAIARWTVDRHTCIHQALAGGVDVIDGEGEMPEVACAAVILAVPVPGQFDLSARRITRGGEKDQGEAPLLVIATRNLDQAKLVAVELERGFEIPDPHHAMQKFHCMLRFNGKSVRSRPFEKSLDRVDALPRWPRLDALSE